MDASQQHIDEMKRNDDGFILARASLGVTSFGMQVADFPPGYDDYPAHDEGHTGQEEVYVVLDGSGWVTLDHDQLRDVRAMDFIRVGPTVHRSFRAGPNGLRLLVVAGVPGGPYEAPAWTAG